MKTVLLSLLLVFALTSVSKACDDYRIYPDMVRQNMQRVFLNSSTNELNYLTVDWIQITRMGVPGDTEIYFGFNALGETELWYMRLGEGKDCDSKIFRKSSKKELYAWRAKLGGRKGISTAERPSLW